jgi:transcriptional regulator
MPQPWAMSDAPSEYIDATLRSIVGIELRVSRIEGKAKLSQNRSDADARAVERAERASGRTELADRMAAVLGEEPA